MSKRKFTAGLAEVVLNQNLARVGGGSKPGVARGEADDFSCNITKDPVHIHDFHATVLQLLGFDHERFTYRQFGLDQRLTGVEPAKVIKELIA